MRELLDEIDLLYLELNIAEGDWAVVKQRLRQVGLDGYPDVQVELVGNPADRDVSPIDWLFAPILVGRHAQLTALVEEERRLAQVFAGDTITDEMLGELRKRFPPKSLRRPAS